MVTNEITKAEASASEAKIDEMITCIESHRNSVHISPDTQHKLHNILTEAIVSEYVQKDLLSFEKNK
jgi:hypothetical protein